LVWVCSLKRNRDWRQGAKNINERE
jgi:hypothetical protein